MSIVILAMLIKDSLILKKLQSATSNIAALLKWGTGQEKDVPMAILAMLMTDSATLNEP